MTILWGRDMLLGKADQGEKMKNKGMPCRPVGENLEETASGIKDQAETAHALGWHDFSVELGQMAKRIAEIGKMVRTGATDPAGVASFPQRNY